MKKINRFCTILLALIMCLSTFSGTTAFAAELPHETTEIYDFEIDLNEISEETSPTPRADVNNTFNVYLEHTGSSRTYSGTYLRYSIEITDVNGNPVDNILAVRLYDSSNNLKRENQFWADGSLNIIQNIPISSGTPYYFKYILAYGTTRTLRVHMEITSYS